MTKRDVSLSALAAVAILLVATPAVAASSGPRNEARLGDSVETVQRREHESVRRQQVRQTQGVPKLQMFFGPLYEGRNSPWQRTKRAVD
ncbi:hypothetical protein Snov_1945 [Ancylobacter novellus DSM 506]|uniref:Secreted protein n=1 Tax=Ancylobacter novellus (strain ATCC 8093 / DSM 506 / JCM 20403 / CCM 1077 / IAM 12100 / NBRC 12443 / NCIMB 10456) TaxID=639283 RepID=D6ZZA9_ANCN5|nr:hypothetical protein [Ancylobacter novellus]ADH89245.1 hypothetical protein Snov_1945 [Ancylobacter novellus DSM 506]